MNKIALFDIDKTLIPYDSFLKWIKLVLNKKKIGWLKVPGLVLLGLTTIGNPKNPEGAQDLARALRTNSTLKSLEYVRGQAGLPKALLCHQGPCPPQAGSWRAGPWEKDVADTLTSGPQRTTPQTPSKLSPPRGPESGLSICLSFFPGPFAVTAAPGNS